MFEAAVVADTGPIVAVLLANEPDHRWAVDQLRELSPPLLTCEPVLTEAFHLLRRVKHGQSRLFQLLGSGLLRVDFRVMDDRASIEGLMSKYADLPMSLADACLVRIAELNPKACVFTLDHHFRIYRKNGRQKIPLLMPERA